MATSSRIAVASTLQAVFGEGDRVADDWDAGLSSEDAGLANALLGKGQIEMAIAGFKAAIQLKTNYAEAHNNLGIAYIGKGQLDDAIEQFREAVRLEPDFADARTNLSIALGTKSRSPQPSGVSTNR